jgi:hypothetical protein
MSRGYFVPDSFTVTDGLRAWAKAKYHIDDAEIDRQFELMQDHEFRRQYSDWSRVFRNWIRKADELGTLKRKRTQRRPEELSAEQKQRDLLKWEVDMKRLGVTPIRAAK